MVTLKSNIFVLTGQASDGGWTEVAVQEQGARHDVRHGINWSRSSLGR